MWKVVTANAGLVTEFEVLQLLKQRGLRTAEEEAAARRAAGEPAEDDEEELLDAPPDAQAAPPPPEPLYPQINEPFPVERAVFERLSRSPAATQDGERLAKFVQLESIELTHAEALQLTASKPRCSVELHAIVEQCAERLSEEEVEQLLQICAEML